jgi:hypothetical protein
MLQLKPDTSAEPLILPDKNSEIVREADSVVDLNEPFQIPEKAITVMRVRTGHFTINVSINTLRPANRLVVTFQGARGGGKDTTNARRPMFGRRNFDALYECPILAISDPQTELDWDSHLPRVGMYLGTFEHDLVPEINALVDKFCQELKISLGRVVMYGSSSGGTSAMLIGSRRKHPTNILTVVPFLRPDKYREEVVAITARAAGGTLDDWNKGMIAQPWRYNPVVALRDAISAGSDIRCVVAQNARDKVTINRHYPGLWRRFDIDPEGGVSPDGRVMAVMFDSPEAGHGHEPDDYARPLVGMAYEFFDKPIAEEGKEKKSKVRERAETRAAIKEQLGMDAKAELRKAAKAAKAAKVANKADKGTQATRAEKAAKSGKQGAKPSKPLRGDKPVKPVKLAGADRSAKPAKAARADKLAKPDKAGRPDKLAKLGKPVRADKLAKLDKPARADKLAKADRLAKAGKSAQAGKADKVVQAGKPNKAVQAGKPNKAVQAGKLNKAVQAGKLNKAVQAGKPNKGVNAAAPGKPNKGVNAAAPGKPLKGARPVKPAAKQVARPSKPVRPNKQAAPVSQPNPIFDTDSDASSGEHIPVTA